MIESNQSISKYQDATVLITGGAGFIGSSLAKKLTELGAKIIVVDNMHPSGGGNLYNIKSIADKINFINENIVESIEHSKPLVDAVKNSQYIFHLAALTGHMDSMNHPLDDLKQNTEATLNLLELCRLHNPEVRIVYTSTRQLYGTPSYLPADENHPVNPLDINGIHKNTNEQYFKLYNSHYKIPTTILRLSNVYGPGLRIKDSRQMFLGLWIRSILEGKTFEIWGGEQIRDLIYIDDVRDAILLSALSNDTAGEIYNVGGMQAANLIQLATILMDSFRTFVTVSIEQIAHYVIKPYPEERKGIEIGDIYLSSEKLKNTIGWTPSTDLKAGLTLTLDYYRQHLREYV